MTFLTKNKARLNPKQFISVTVLFSFTFSITSPFVQAAQTSHTQKRIYFASDLGSGIASTRFAKHPLGPSINLRTGNLFLSYKDIELHPLEIPFVLQRHYNSNSKTVGLFGSGWSSNLDISLVDRAQNGVFIRDTDGFILKFTPNVNTARVHFGPGKRNTFFSRSRGLQLVEKRGRFYRWIDSQGNTKIFDRSGKLTQIMDRNGRIQKLHYYNNKLLKVEDSLGRNLTLLYDKAFPHFISQVKDSSGNEFIYQYSENGDLKQVTDPLGRIITFDHRGHLLTSITYPHNDARIIIDYNKDKSTVASIKGPERFSYDFSYHHPNAKEEGHKTEVVDGNGNRTTYEYKKGGSNLLIVDALGSVQSFQYHPATNSIIHKTDARGATTSFEYDSLGRIIKTVDPLGHATTYSYRGEFGGEITITDPTGNLLTVEANSKGDIVSIHNTSLNTSIKYNYDSLGNLIEAIDSKGNKTSLKYDKNGNLLSVTDAEGNRRSFDYDSNSRKTQLTNPRGYKMRLKYDRLGNILQIIDPLNQSVRFKYNEINRLISFTDRNGNGTRYFYDGLGNLSEVINPAGGRVQFVYGNMGNLVRVVDPKGQVYRNEYDGLNRRVTEIDPLNHKREYTYDRAGNMTSIKDALGNTWRYKHNLKGKLLSITNPSGMKKEFLYRPHLKSLLIKDFQNNTWIYKYEAGRRLIGTVDPLGNNTAYKYDISGNIIEIIDASGVKTTFKYDRIGRLIEKMTSRGKKAVFENDPSGNVVSKLDPNGNEIKYAYDPFDRLINTIYPDGSTVQFKYDPSGNVIEETNKHVTISYEYNSLNRIQKVSYAPLGVSLNYQYDVSGLRTKLADSMGNAFYYHYDPVNRLKEISGLNGVKIIMDYDHQSRISRITYPNGITSRYSYNSLDDLVDLITQKANGEMIARHLYSYDDIGNVVNIEEMGKKRIAYQYDKVAQLLKVAYTDGNETVYGYYPNGNRKLKKNHKVLVEYTYDADNQLIKQGDIVFNYDLNGNLLKKTDNNGETKFEYDYDNRLVGVYRHDGQKIRFRYSPNGKRLWKKSDANEKYYVHDHFNVVLELDKGFRPTTTYMVGDYIDQSFGFIRDGEKYYYHFDKIGSIRVITDQKENILSSYRYDEFGQIIKKPVRFENSFSFTGREFDAETSLYFYRTRYYDPSVGRFISRDIKADDLTRPLSLNKYIYVENNPVLYIDPMGTSGGGPLRPPGWRPPGPFDRPGPHRPIPRGRKDPGGLIEGPPPGYVNPDPIPTWDERLPDGIKPPFIPGPGDIINDPGNPQPHRNPKGEGESLFEWARGLLPEWAPSPSTVLQAGVVIVLTGVAIATLPEQVLAGAAVVLIATISAGGAEASPTQSSGPTIEGVPEGKEPYDPTKDLPTPQGTREQIKTARTLVEGEQQGGEQPGEKDKKRPVTAQPGTYTDTPKEPGRQEPEQQLPPGPGPGFAGSTLEGPSGETMPTWEGQVGQIPQRTPTSRPSPVPTTQTPPQQTARAPSAAGQPQPTPPAPPAGGHNVDPGPLWGGGNPCGLCKEAQYMNCLSLPYAGNNQQFCRRHSSRCPACPGGGNLTLAKVKRGCYQTILYQKAEARPELDMATLQKKAEGVCACDPGTKCASWRGK